MFNSVNAYRVAQIAIAAVLIYFIFISYAFSFRVQSVGWEWVFNANSARWGLSLLGGLSLGMSGAVMLTQHSLLNHVRYFGVFMFVAVVFFVSRWWVGSVVLASILGFISLIVCHYVSLWCLKQRAAQNIIFMLLLVTGFIGSVLVYGFASVEQQSMGNVLAWLFGDLTIMAMQSVTSVLAMTFLVAGLSALICLNRHRNIAAPMLFGLGVGMLGAVFFISAMAPIIAKKLRVIESPYYYLYSALLAGAMVVVAVHLPRLLVGGYSPSLLITNAILFMPLVVYLQITQQLNSSKGKALKAIEWSMLLVFSVLTVFVVWHLGQFAQGVI